MCLNARYIFNPYSRRKVLVNCGKCKACLQEKACARSNRIRNNIYDGEIALFVTLTYKNEFVPYVRKSDLCLPGLDVDIYRDSSCRLVFSKKKGLYTRLDSNVCILDSTYVPCEVRSIDLVKSLQSLRHGDVDKVGVCFYPDFQNFLKRLRQILKRDFNYEGKFNYFVCSEYGETFKRPHFHALLYIRQNDEEMFRHSILKAWPYADSRRAAKYIEVAKDVASYVSSYVNGNLNLFPLLSLPKFAPQHHMSKGFGVGLDAFSLPAILYKIDIRDLHFYRRQKDIGKSSNDSVLIPQYVLNRYFPRHKGFSRLTTSQLYGLLLDPSRASELNEYVLGNYLYSYSPIETYRIYVSLENAFRRFNRITNLNRFDYAYYYVNAWTLSALTSLKDSLVGVETFEEWNDFYLNALDGFYDPSICPTLDVSSLQLNPNQRSDAVEKNNHFLELYQKLDKSRKVVNYVMSANGHNV